MIPVIPSLSWRARSGLLAAVLISPVNISVCDQVFAAPSGSAMVEYRNKLEAYTRARQQFEAQAGPYWTLIADKRRLRNAKRRNGEPIVADDYVLAQPPAYTGPERPLDPSGKTPPPAPEKYIPVEAELLAAAAENFRFVPTRPSNELEFKRSYADTAARAGLTRDQIVRIYGFEAGGNGRYNLQAGLDGNRPNARPISTAMGYNQLLATNSVELMAEKGDDFLKVLRAIASLSGGERRKAVEQKISILQRMIAFARTVPDVWSEHDKLSNTPRGWGVHAMVLDADVGPLLQVQKLLTSINFARMKGHFAPLSAAELEMMNLTGDGNGLDMVTMPQAMREIVPTSNFFQRGGYERNPVARRNNVVAKLIAATDARMDREVSLQGAKDMAAAYPHR